MKYYKIEAEKGTSGHSPQVKGVIKNGTFIEYFNELKKINQIMLDEKVDGKLDFDAFQLYGTAKRNDFIFSIPFLSQKRSMLVSQKLGNIITSFSMQPESQIFDVPVIHRKKEYQFQLFYSYDLGCNVVDTKKIEFWDVDEKTKQKLERFEFSTRKEYIDNLRNNVEVRSKKRTLLLPNKLVLRENLRLDFFRIYMGLANGYYVSGKLKNAIEEAECTGISFTPVEDLVWLKD